MPKKPIPDSRTLNKTPTLQQHKSAHVELLAKIILLYDEIAKVVVS